MKRKSKQFVVNNYIQYQQKQQLPLTSNYTTKKGPRHMLMKIQILVWERHTNMAGLHW
jgi:hypothetical protein